MSTIRLPTVAGWLFVATIGLLQALPGAAQEAPTVSVSTPEIRTLRTWATFTGRFDAVEHVDIRARVTGYLQSVHFEAGVHVDRGDLLFVIDPRPFEAALAHAEAEAKRARSRLELAEIDRERGERLLARDAIAREDVQTRQTESEIASAEVAAAEAALQQARLELDYTRIVAPVSGRVSSRNVDVGNLVHGDAELPLTTLVTQDPIHFVFDVSETTYLEWSGHDDSADPVVAPGLPVQLKLLGAADWRYQGRLDFIDNRLDHQTATLRMRAEFDNPDGRLRPGQFGRLRVPTSAPHEAMLVPAAAIRTDQAAKTVFVVNADNVVETRLVETGALRGDMRIISNGLVADDRVIVSGLLHARPGATVDPRSAGREEQTAGTGRGAE